MSHRTNPLKEDALTIDSVQLDQQVICWTPELPDSRREWTIKSGVYPDDDGTLVVELTAPDGSSHLRSADQIGLCGNRYTGEWSHICIPNDVEE